MLKSTRLLLFAAPADYKVNDMTDFMKKFEAGRAEIDAALKKHRSNHGDK